MYFAEAFPSISEKDRCCVLYLAIPHIVSTSNCTENAWWFIETAIELELFSLLHLTFIEDAMFTTNPSIRAAGASALLDLPISYWDQAQQHERRAQLIELARQDESELVRQIITNHSNET
ncbi:MAG: hypothetical protein CMJ35_03180 [Phycisphaerae bacterium]|nr:hypothetical protein [Phycisphaerae bacterium]HCT43636.1 hypothetical protein [Phycisphaerales bacterium]